MGNKNRQKEKKEFDSSRLKIMDKKYNMNEENMKKNNCNQNNKFNLNYFNRNYSGKKKS